MAGNWLLTTHTVNAYCYYEGVFEKESLDAIIEMGDNRYEKTLASIGGQGGGGVVDPEIRKTTITWIPPEEETAWLYRRLTDIITEANSKWFGFELEHIESLQYSVYHEGDFYDKHVDHHFQGPGQYSRKLSFVMQLTDPSEYEGGKTLMHTEKTPFAIPQTKGTITFFPSYTLHEVEPVTKGIRKALVGWVSGPKWK